MENAFQTLEIGKGRKLKDGKQMAILSFGHPGNFVTKAIEQLASQGIDPAHYDMRFVKPIDEAMLHEVFTKYEYIITVEDGCIQGRHGFCCIRIYGRSSVQGYSKTSRHPR